MVRNHHGPSDIGFGSFSLTNPWAGIIIFIAAIVAAFNGIFKVYALRHIDTTIYFPLLKLLSPVLAIIFGIVFFSENFSRNEWIGLGIGLVVPLLLITKLESARQNNLKRGLMFVLVTGVISAGVAALNKYAMDLSPNTLALVTYVTFGIVLGSWLSILIKRGLRGSFKHIIDTEHRNQIIFWSLVRSMAVTTTVALMLFAYGAGGPLAIVHTIHSLFIVIPIVLSIIFYNEHWNLQKVVAIVLSVAALALLG